MGEINSYEAYQRTLAAETSGLSIFLFCLPNCPACDVLKPKYERLGCEFAGEKIRFHKVRAEGFADRIFDEEEVGEYPTILIYENGQTPVAKIVGDKADEEARNLLVERQISSNKAVHH